MPGAVAKVTEINCVLVGATRVVAVQILTDALAEPDETVRLSLGQPVSAQLGQPYTATLTIHDSPWYTKLFLPLARR